MTHGKDLKKWQRLALIGAKWKAILECRKETGLGLKLARPLVEKYIKDSFK
tara:strand:+ start:143 stop:295 length:153 start_codon:yes stop_codon:yes gene_type:complete